MQSQAYDDIALVETMMRLLLGHGPVADAVAYHLESGGARTRARLALKASAVLGIDQSAALSCASASELLHNASLVHDDVQEGDALRRGKPALWRKFGLATAVSAGDLMISSAFAGLATHPDPATALGLLHDAVAQTVLGQAIDLEAGATSVDEYIKLASAKTGPLLALPVRLALSAAGQGGDRLARDTGYAIAVAYQVRDDLADRDADRAGGRINLCALLEARGLTPYQAFETACHEGSGALRKARRLAALLPGNSGRAFCNLADQLESAFMEISHAA